LSLIVLSAALALGALSGCIQPTERKSDPEAAKRELQQLQKNRQKEWSPPSD
jgi:hypothetical protein